MTYSILSPYLVPVEKQKTKKANIGDGFILNRIIEMLHPHKCACILSSRKMLNNEEIARINSTSALVLAGGNQLNDNFTIVPGMDLSVLKRITVPVVPFGIGISGIADKNMGMSAPTMEILKEIHVRIGYSSWRCPRTVKYLLRHLPDIGDKLLMTGCPVAYDAALLEGKPFTSSADKVVVTITERDDFWEREFNTINCV